MPVGPLHAPNAGYALDPEYRTDEHDHLANNEVMTALKTVIRRIYHDVCALPTLCMQLCQPRIANVVRVHV
jgi:hypothetical protein